jgi:hypothetical protein
VIVVVLVGFVGMFCIPNRRRERVRPPRGKQSASTHRGSADAGRRADRHEEVLASTRPALNLVLVREG